ncbi:MAG: ion transporter [Planctomycetota bacterium]
MADAPTPPTETPRPEAEGLRAWLYHTIFEHETRAGFVFDVLLLIVIVLSILLVMVESVSHLEAEYGTTLRALEWAMTIAFTVEYLTRLYCHPNPGVYARSFFGIVDLLAILPTYLAQLLPGAQALVVVRMLRLLRVFRVLKLVQFVTQADDLHSALRASLPKIVVFVIAVISLTTISGSVLYLIEGPEHGFHNIPESVYWAIVTLTTVGYGDISPETPVGKLFASIIMVMGYGVIAVPTGIVSAELARIPPRRYVGGRVCPGCGAEGHAREAEYCNRCGTSLDV